MTKGKFLYGLDISLKDTGVTIYDLEKKEFVFVDSFNTEKIYATKEHKNLHLNALKLHMISLWMSDIIEKYPPYVVSIERMFSRFPMETQAIAKATGVIQHLLWDVPQFLYAPKEVKLKIVHGNATKEDVANSIKTKYNDITFRNDDESDSFAVCLTCLIEHDLIQWDKPVWSDIVAMREPKEEKPKKPKKPTTVKKRVKKDKNT